MSLFFHRRVQQNDVALQPFVIRGEMNDRQCPVRLLSYDDGLEPHLVGGFDDEVEVGILEDVHAGESTAIQASVNNCRLDGWGDS